MWSNTIFCWGHVRRACRTWLRFDVYFKEVLYDSGCLGSAVVMLVNNHVAVGEMVGQSDVACPQIPPHTMTVSPASDTTFVTQQREFVLFGGKHVVFCQR